MKTRNSSHKLYCEQEVYNTFFSKNKCYVSTNTPMNQIYFLNSIAHKNDKIILIDEIQESDLENKGDVHDGFKKSKLNNLKYVYMQKYKLKSKKGSKNNHYGHV